jgi:hypothetical protein
MNVFYTNSCPIACAEEHCIKHRNKMIIEHTQLLSTAHHVLDGSAPEGAYKKTHRNHPSAIWARGSIDHYEWLWLCTKHLCELYTQRTGKIHKTEAVLDLLIDPPHSIDTNGFSEPPVAAPEEFKLLGVNFGACVAYRACLNSKFAEWLGRDKPLVVEFDIKPDWVTI